MRKIIFGCALFSVLAWSFLRAGFDTVGSVTATGTISSGSSSNEVLAAGTNITMTRTPGNPGTNTISSTAAGGGGTLDYVSMYSCETNQYVPSGVATLLNFSITNTVNGSSMWGEATNAAIRILGTGSYQFNQRVRVDRTSSGGIVAYMYLYKNGVNLTLMDGKETTQATLVLHGEAKIDATSNDYFQTYVHITATTPYIIGTNDIANASNFDAIKLK